MIDDVAGDSAVLRKVLNGVVALGGESAFKIEEFLLAVTGGGEEVGEVGAVLDLHGDGVPVVGAMAFDGGGEEKVLPRAPSLTVVMVAVVVVLVVGITVVVVVILVSLLFHEKV